MGIVATGVLESLLEEISARHIAQMQQQMQLWLQSYIANQGLLPANIPTLSKNEWMDVAQAAEYARVHRKTILRWIADGRLLASDRAPYRCKRKDLDAAITAPKQGTNKNTDDVVSMMQARLRKEVQP